MMKYSILIVTLLMLAACGDNSTPATPAEPTPIELADSDTFTGRGYRIKTLDGCEYIKYRGSDWFGLTHKGDCSNPIHCYNE